jgi:hypothetical protein
MQKQASKLPYSRREKRAFFEACWPTVAGILSIPASRYNFVRFFLSGEKIFFSTVTADIS